MEPDHYWYLHIPDYNNPTLAPSQSPTASPLDQGTDRAAVLDRVARLLAPHPKRVFRLCNGERFVASTPPRSQLSEDTLGTALHAAGRYNGHPPMGRGLHADRVQRLTLGINELFQAEMIADSQCSFDQLDEELLAARRCLRSVPKAHAGQDISPARDVDDEDSDEDIDQ